MSETVSFQLLSPAFKDGCDVPIPYTCRGQGVSPPLNIIGVPENIVCLALIMHDPDAVSGDFSHWVMWDMPATTATIAAHSVPVGAVQGKNDAGTIGYTPPCPPVGSGLHHYVFKLLALSKPVSLAPGSNREQLQKAAADLIVAKTELTGIFSAN